jgi:hypothetical protein
VKVKPPDWYGLVIGLVALCTVGVGVALIAGPSRWVSSRSLAEVSTYIPIPWSAYGVFFILAGAGLANWRTRLYSYFLLALVLTVFVGCAAFYTLFPGETTNVIVAGFSPLSALMLWAAVRYAARAEKLHRANQQRPR